MTGLGSDPHTLARFWAKVDKTETCWLWLGAKNPSGYGFFYYDGRPGLAHRFSCRTFRGPIDGLSVDHLCRNTSCVNPTHLEAVTQAVNLDRGYSRNFSAAAQRAKTHCPKGHEYGPANTYAHNGRRHCRACRTEASRRFKRRKNAIPESQWRAR